MQIAFMPWLRLGTPLQVAGVSFVPWRQRNGTVFPELAAVDSALAVIFAGYRDRDGTPIDNGVVAVAGGDIDLQDEQFDRVRWAVSLLFLSAWASNDYYTQLGSYVNSSYFSIVGQRFTNPPQWISLTARRRAGHIWDGGYQHGQVPFQVPLQCTLRENATVDLPLLAALDAANTAASPTIARLRTAMPYVELANTDDNMMTPLPEAILMASAFEQLLQGEASKYVLGREFGAVLRQYGSITVADAMRARPTIMIDHTDPQRTAAQPAWWVHRKWMEELYDVRSRSVHGGDVAGRAWAWHTGEHLVMAAWVFPMTVKLLLQGEGQYTLADADEDRALSVDKLLTATRWADGDQNSRWSAVLNQARDDRRMRAFRAQHPDFFQEGPDDHGDVGAE